MFRQDFIRLSRCSILPQVDNGVYSADIQEHVSRFRTPATNASISFLKHILTITAQNLTVVDVANLMTAVVNEDMYLAQTLQN
jgi:hypothetical protein